MRIINMLADYKKLCEDSEISGNWIAWKNYISCYNDLFSAILKGLYMTDLENLKPMIEGIEFKGIYSRARSRAEEGCVEEILKWVDESLKYLDF